VTVDTSSVSVNSDFSDSFYSKIPLGRGVSSLFYLAPGVTSGLATGAENPSISGSSGLENLYVADGVSVNDPAFAGSACGPACTVRSEPVSTSPS